MIAAHFGIEDRSFDPDYNELAAMPASRKDGNQELKTNTGAIQRFVQANGQQGPGTTIGA